MREISLTSLYDARGNRKYLTHVERDMFLAAVRNAKPEVATFCVVMAYTGARISEVLALVPSQFDFDLQCVIFECLKKRSRGTFRAVPVPKSVLVQVDATHDLKNLATSVQKKEKRIWPWSRTTAWHRVTDIMREAGLGGVRATPKGLRHTFGVSAVQAGVSLNMVQKWMGHSDISTTSIYANATGEEELSIARKLWEYIENHPT